jgi:two-component system copper resistance phosphate regulon response regulator CusR
MRILLVEDEPSAARMLAKGLREQAYAVDVASDGARALYEMSITDYDAVVLDVMLPVQDGLSVCRQIRQTGSVVPVLMLTARDGVDSRIEGLDSGADDYLTKPFDFGELLARLRAIIRRGTRPVTPRVLRAGGLELDLHSRTASRRGRSIPLTAREYALLEYLMLHAGTVVGRAAIAEHVWEASYDPLSNVIDVYVQRLRRKIDPPGMATLIVTRRGEGYLIAASTDPP